MDRPLGSLNHADPEDPRVIKAAVKAIDFACECLPELLHMFDGTSARLEVDIEAAIQRALRSTRHFAAHGREGLNVD